MNCLDRLTHENRVRVLDLLQNDILDSLSRVILYNLTTCHPNYGEHFESVFNARIELIYAGKDNEKVGLFRTCVDMFIWHLSPQGIGFWKSIVEDIECSTKIPEKYRKQNVTSLQTRTLTL